MKCLIKRTNCKSKRYTRFYFDEAVLKQNRCETSIKKRICPHCGETINCVNKLERHLRSCEKTTTHPAKLQLRQMTLDGPTSSKNGPSVPKKLMVEEMQVGGAPVEYVKHWKAPEIVESALKYTALTFREAFNTNNKWNVLQRWIEVIHSMRPVTDEQERSSCYILLRDVQVYQDPRTLLLISCRI